MSEKFKRFWENGGQIKMVLWILSGLLLFVLKFGWTSSKYDSRLCDVEGKLAQHEAILRAVPQIQADISVIRNDLSWLKSRYR